MFNKYIFSWDVQPNRYYDQSKAEKITKRNYEMDNLEFEYGMSFWDNYVRKVTSMYDSYIDEKSIVCTNSKQDYVRKVNTAIYESYIPDADKANDDAASTAPKEIKEIKAKLASKKLAVLDDDMRQMFRDLKLSVTYQYEARHYSEEDIFEAYDRFTTKQADMIARGNHVRSPGGFFMTILRDEFIAMEAENE